MYIYIKTESTLVLYTCIEYSVPNCDRASCSKTKKKKKKKKNDPSILVVNGKEMKEEESKGKGRENNEFWYGGQFDGTRRAESTSTDRPTKRSTNQPTNQPTNQIANQPERNIWATNTGPVVGGGIESFLTIYLFPYFCTVSKRCLFHNQDESRKASTNSVSRLIVFFFSFFCVCVCI